MWVLKESGVLRNWDRFIFKHVIQRRFFEMFRFSMHDDGRCHLQTLQGKFCHLTVPNLCIPNFECWKWSLQAPCIFNEQKKGVASESTNFTFGSCSMPSNRSPQKIQASKSYGFNQWGQQPTNQPLMYSTYSCDITFRTHKKSMVCSTEVSKKWNRQECLGIIPTSRPVFSWNLWHLCNNSYTT